MGAPAPHGAQGDKKRPAPFRMYWKEGKPGFRNFMFVLAIGQVSVYVFPHFRCTCYFVSLFSVVSINAGGCLESSSPK